MIYKGEKWEVRNLDVKEYECRKFRGKRKIGGWDQRKPMETCLGFWVLWTLQMVSWGK